MREAPDPIRYVCARGAPLALALAVLALAACSGHHSSGPSCTDACIVGASRCGSATSVEVCGAGQDGCLAWLAGATCGGANPCEVGPSGAACATAVDPLYPAQWHLKNTGQSHGVVTGVAGMDVDVEPVWSACAGASTCRGEGVLVAVVDTGVQILHPDLEANVAPGASHNYLNGTTDPTPAQGSPRDDAHGTAVAGLVAARDLNGVGGRGVAPRASLAGYNFLLAQSLSSLVDSMTRNAAAVSVNTNSWGPASDGNLAPAEDQWKLAVEQGLATGRGGKGTIYTFAGGNGAFTGANAIGSDDSNYNGYANFHGVMAIAAISAVGVKSSYSSEGANLWLAAPGGEFCNTLAITTTDLTGSAGFNAGGAANDLADGDYTQCMNGTSSATPNVAGVVALVVQANPNLTWRDVRLVLASTARKIDEPDADWTMNGAGFHVSHKYGFGLVDANAAVTAAKTWSNVAPLLSCTSALRQPNLAIPDSPASPPAPPLTPGTPVQDSVTMTGCPITSIEFVEVTFSAADHTYFGDLDVRLSRAATPTVSRLARTHVCHNANGSALACTPSYNGWVFGTTHHLGEDPNGTWTLTVFDGNAQDTGTFQSWQLKFYGH